MGSGTISKRAFWLANGAWAIVVVAVVATGRPGEGEGVPGDVAGAGGAGVLTVVGAEGGGGGAATAGARASGGGANASGEARGSAIGARLQAALGLADPLARVGKVSELLLGLNAGNVDEVLAALEEGPRGGVDDALFREFLSSWARFDGEAAVAYAQSDESGRRVRGGDDAVVRAWASVDPDRAIAFVSEQPKNENTSALYHEVVESLAETDLARAAEFAMQNQKSRARGESIDLLAREMFEEGGSAGLERWLAGIDMEGERDMASYKRYAFAEATERIPDDQIEGWITKHLDAGYVDARAMYTAAGKLNDEDRAGRVDWLAGMPEGGARNEAMGWAVDRWAREDATAASAWLSEQELGEAYDPAVRALAGRLAGEDPAAAMSWGNVIESERGRGEMLWRVGRDWIRKDKAAAATWLSENEVPQRILEGLARYLD